MSNTSSNTSSPSPWIIASSCAFFIPAGISFFTQNIIVFIILFNAAFFSTLYHIDEHQYEIHDMIFAMLAIIIGLLLLALLVQIYPVYHWRVLIPVMFTIAAVFMYFYEGSCEEPPCSGSYEMYHSLWHLFMTIAGTIVVLKPLSLSNSFQLTYKDIVSKMIHDFSSSGGGGGGTGGPL